MTEPWYPIGATDDFFDDTPMPVQAGEHALCVVRRGNHVFALADWCSHGNARLSEGFVEGNDVECPFHQGRFCLRTGVATVAPATEPVATYPTKIQDGTVWVAVSAAPAPAAD
jgi:nitrite reductase/ring-hydroxylating ferredoxin subunit